MHLLTGSADLMSVPGAGDSLAGRAETTPLAPLSQGEFQGKHDDFAARVFADSPTDKLVGWSTTTSREALVSAITTGGYPESAIRPENRRGRWLTEYVERFLKRDLRDLGNVSSARLASTLRLIAANQGGELVVAHLARHLSVAECLEVKATTAVTAKHFAGLRKMKDRVGADFRLGVVLHTGERAWSFGDGMVALPVSALWEL